MRTWGIVVGAFLFTFGLVFAPLAVHAVFHGTGTGAQHRIDIQGATPVGQVGETALATIRTGEVIAIDLDTLDPTVLSTHASPVEPRFLGRGPILSLSLDQTRRIEDPTVVVAHSVDGSIAWVRTVEDYDRAMLVPQAISPSGVTVLRACDWSISDGDEAGDVCDLVAVDADGSDVWNSRAHQIRMANSTSRPDAHLAPLPLHALDATALNDDGGIEGVARIDADTGEVVDLTSGGGVAVGERFLATIEPTDQSAQGAGNLCAVTVYPDMDPASAPWSLQWPCPPLATSSSLTMSGPLTMDWTARIEDHGDYLEMPSTTGPWPSTLIHIDTGTVVQAQGVPAGAMLPRYSHAGEIQSVDEQSFLSFVNASEDVETVTLADGSRTRIAANSTTLAVVTASGSWNPLISGDSSVIEIRSLQDLQVCAQRELTSVLGAQPSSYSRIDEQMLVLTGCRVLIPSADELILLGP